MGIERLQHILNFSSGDRFFVLYGPGTQDVFISPNYTELNIEQALWHTLREQQFERIIFYSLQRQVYFLDEISRRRCDLPPARAIQPSSGGPSCLQRLGGGPMGNLNIAPAKVDIKTTAVPSSSPHKDFHALSLLNTWMQDTDGPPTALVILQADTFLEQFEDPRSLAVLMGEWTRLPSTNRNVCVLQFAADQYEGLVKAAERLPELKAYLQRPERDRRKYNIVCPGPPDEAEIDRLIDYTRLKDKVEVNWQQRPNLVRWIAAEGKDMREWIALLRSARRLDRQTAIEKRWFAAAPDERSAWERLDALVGLEPVKAHIKQLVDYVVVEKRRKEAGLAGNAAPPVLHLVFTGNPGTGKTTVARLIGEIYRDLGLLRRGHTETPESSTLVADHVGGSAIKTNAAVDRALDGVLFIDEAYRLTEEGRGGFGREVVDTLITRLENDHDRLVVIVAGYPEPMRRFINANKGLPGRFPPENYIEFPDYLAVELLEILRRMLAERNLTYTPEMLNRLSDLVEGLYAGRDVQQFDNARRMRSLADALTRTRAGRVLRENLPIDAPLQPEDIPADFRSYLPPPIPEVDDLLSELDKMVGLQPVKNLIRQQIFLLRHQERRRKQGYDEAEHPILHMCFIGNPGTGKSSVARLMGKILHALGLLYKGDTVEVSGSDLIAGYLGQTALKTAEVIDKAMDGVLFIDEAYALIPGPEGTGSFARDAMNELVKAMGDRSDRLVVIAAGYPKEMQDFIQSNSGLTRRFPLNVHFDDYTTQDLLLIMRNKAKKDEYHISTQAESRAALYLDALRKVQGRHFGNAGAAINLYKAMINRLAEREVQAGLGEDAPPLTTFEASDVPEIDGMDATPVKLHTPFDLIRILPSAPDAMLSLDQAQQAVGRLDVTLPNGATGTGTAFCVTQEGHLLTAYHVVETAQKIDFRLESDPQHPLSAKLVGWDTDADLAVLRLDPGRYAWVPLCEPGYRPSLREKVMVLSFPLGEELGQEVTYTEGVVSSLRGEGALIQISATVTHGSSGAPLFRCSDQHVIGVIHGGVKQDVASGYNFAVNAALVYRCFDGN